MDNKILTLALIPCIVTAGNLQETIHIQPKDPFWEETIRRVEAYEKIQKNELYSATTDVVKWDSSNYIGALRSHLYNECRIYAHQKGNIIPLFSYPDCKFTDEADISYARRTTMPDIVFKMSLMPSNTPGPADHYVVAVYDDKEDLYCTSQSLAAWYQLGSINMPSEPHDIICPAPLD